MSGFRLLIAEDDGELRELLGEVLQAEGFETLATANGAEALALFRGGHLCDAIITDDDMPRLRGRDLVSILRAEGFALPIVLISGSLDLSDDERARLRVGPVVPKPLDFAGLVRTIREALEKRT